MTNELIANSQDRAGTPVIWIVIHTTEGAFDSAPDNPSIDPGSADGTVNGFRGTIGTSHPTSAHAVADDDKIIDNLVPYSRAAYTLRNGNNRSDNLELCGRAGWDRATWLTHMPMLRFAARWIAQRWDARNFHGVPQYGGVPAVRARIEGVIGHIDYTDGTGDGTHWDPGPNFPWDVVMPMARQFFTGQIPPVTPVLTPIERIVMGLFTADERAEYVNATREAVRGALLDTIRGLDDPGTETGGRGRAVAVELAAVIREAAPPVPPTTP